MHVRPLEGLSVDLSPERRFEPRRAFRRSQTRIKSKEKLYHKLTHTIINLEVPQSDFPTLFVFDYALLSRGCNGILEIILPKKHKNGKNHADAFKGQTEKLGKEKHQKNMVESQGCLYPFAFAAATQIISVTMLYLSNCYLPLPVTQKLVFPSIFGREAPF